MGLFDGMLGGIVGAEMATVVNGLIERHGGVQGMVDQMRSNGLGPAVHAWVNEGPNAAVAPKTCTGRSGIRRCARLPPKPAYPPKSWRCGLLRSFPTPST